MIYEIVTNPKTVNHNDIKPSGNYIYALLNPLDTVFSRKR